MSYYWPA